MYRYTSVLDLGMVCFSFLKVDGLKVVRAQIISYGDQRSYYLTTAANAFGVILAQSPSGHSMTPISWEEMMCPVTKVVEMRKCAKPV